MSNVFLTQDINTAILIIAEELRRMNDFKEKELIIKYGEHSFENLKRE
jgi:hypothetical protein